MLPIKTLIIRKCIRKKFDAENVLCHTPVRRILTGLAETKKNYMPTFGQACKIYAHTPPLANVNIVNYSIYKERLNVMQHPPPFIQYMRIEYRILSIQFSSVFFYINTRMSMYMCIVCVCECMCINVYDILARRFV